MDKISMKTLLTGIAPYCFAVALAWMAAGCDAIRYPPESIVYRPAVEFLRAATNLPAGTVIDPQKNARMYIAKNAAQAEINIEYADAGGAKITESCVVYLSRINRTWVADRYVRVPRRYGAEAPATP